MAPNTQSVVLHRALTDASFSAGTWPATPGAATVTRTTASWTAVAGAPIQGVQFTSGSLDAKVQALVGTIDPTDFAVDRDRTKITAAGIANLTIN